MRSYKLLFPMLLLCSCTSISRTPSATDKAVPEIDQVIPLDSHQHYVPNSDGFLGAKPECEYNEWDLKFWEDQKDEVIKNLESQKPSLSK